ncbi:MAG: hypothetical protein ACE367_10730 [Acidimicrobiales bacterium]
MSDRTEGVLLNREDGVFFVPEDQLAQFRVPDEAAEEIRAKAGDDEVSGFRSDKLRAGELRPNIREIKWGFDGPIKLGNTYSLAPTVK